MSPLGINDGEFFPVQREDLRLTSASAGRLWSQWYGCDSYAFKGRIEYLRVCHTFFVMPIDRFACHINMLVFLFRMSDVNTRHLISPLK